MVSKRGATQAIKIQIEELSEQMEDHNKACAMAFTEVREIAQKRLETVCA